MEKDKREKLREKREERKETTVGRERKETTVGEGLAPPVFEHN